MVITGPNRSDLLRGFAPAAAAALAFLLVFGLLGGWFLAGRMLAPLTPDRGRGADGRERDRCRTGSGCTAARTSSASSPTCSTRCSNGSKRTSPSSRGSPRTPPTNSAPRWPISKSLLDAARDDPARRRDELVERLHTVNTRAIDLTEALLLLSRADRRNFTREAVDLSLLAEEAAETLLPQAEQAADHAGRHR